MDGIRARGVPRLVVVLEHDFGRRLWDEDEFRPVRDRCENIGRPNFVQLQAGDAALALWRVLTRLPEELAKSPLLGHSTCRAMERGVACSNE